MPGQGGRESQGRAEKIPVVGIERRTGADAGIGSVIEACQAWGAESDRRGWFPDSGGDGRFGLSLMSDHGPSVIAVP